MRTLTGVFLLFHGTNKGHCVRAYVKRRTQASIIVIPVDRPAMREITVLAAAIAAGFAVDVWNEFDDLQEIKPERSEALQTRHLG